MTKAKWLNSGSGKRTKNRRIRNAKTDDEVAKEKKAFRKKVTDIRTKSDKSIEKELTKEQIEKWKQYRRENAQKRRKNIKNRKDKRHGKNGDFRKRSERRDRRNDRD